MDASKWKDYETEFVKAVDKYKSKYKRSFPTLREYLAILISLGYRKVETSTDLPVPMVIIRGTPTEAQKVRTRKNCSG